MQANYAIKLFELKLNSNYLKPSISSSVNCGHMAANRSLLTVILDYLQKCGWCLEKWSGWNPTNAAGDYGPAN